MPFAGVLDDRQLTRFRNEAQAAASLEHPHIVNVFFVGHERGVHFYAMRYIDGSSLAEVIEQLKQDGDRKSGSAAVSSVQTKGNPDSNLRSGGSDTVPVAALTTQYSFDRRSFYRRVAGLGVQAAQALQYAHEMGVVHRDVKPSNLLVDHQGHLWVTDFGLAATQATPNLTMTGDLLGTLRYMSPEQAAGKRGVLDHRTDIYSLGATLYEIVTLQPAVPGTDRQDILRHIAEQEPIAPQTRADKCPRDLETIILKSLSKEPRDRYATALQLADDLTRFLESRPIEARRPGLAQSMVKWTRRHRTVVTTAAITFLLSLLVSVVSIARAYQSERAQHKVAVHEKTQAQNEKARAEASLRLARKAVDDMYIKIATEWLTGETAPTQMQKGFLRMALDLYQQLVREAIDDPSQRQESAEAYERIGEIRGYLDNHDAADVALRKSLEMREQLLTYNPDDKDRRIALVGGYRKLAEVDKLLVKFDQAQEAYDQGLAHLAVLKQRLAGTSGFKKASAEYALGRAELLARRGQLDRAEQLAREGRQTMATILADYKGTLEGAVWLHQADYRLTQILRYRGQREEATDLCRQALQQCNFSRGSPGMTHGS